MSRPAQRRKAAPSPPTSAPALVAAVSGFPAFVIANLLEARLPERLVALQRLVEKGQLPPALLAEVTAQWAAIIQAAQEWAQYRAAVDGSTAGPPAAIPERSAEIDTAAAAGLLGVTPNRVRQLVRDGSLPARKASRTWLVDRTAVDLRRELAGV